MLQLRSASVTEVEDESTISKMPDEARSVPGRLGHTRSQMPKRQNKTAQSGQTSDQNDHIFVEEPIDEEGRRLPRGSGATAEERDEATSENEKPSRAGSLVLSSGHTS